MIETPLVEAAPRATGRARFDLRGWVAGTFAFVIYLIASLATFGGTALAHLGTEYVPPQRASDSEFFRWALAWTPWAVMHGKDPLYTNVLHAPQGTSLVWTTAVPGPALAMWPVTAVFGPLVSYNVLTLLAPALAGWAAYLLCRRISHRFWPSLAGGAVFGFSAYTAIQLIHPNLSLTFPIPLLAYLVVRRVEGSLGRNAFVALSAITLLALWSVSIELFATTTMFGALALVLAWLVGGPNRDRIVSVLPALGVGYAIAVAMVFFPYLLPALRQAPASVVIDPEQKHNDLLRFVLPRDRQLVGGSWLQALSARMADPTKSDVAFVGIGLVAMVIGFAITERRRKATWAVITFLLIAVVLSLGPALWVHNLRLIPLPGAILARLPLIKNALPSRFTIFVSLTLAVIASLWLSAGRGRGAWLRWGVVVIGILLTIPNIESPPWHAPDATPAFFSDGSWAGVISPGETVAIMGQKKGQDMAWQAQTNMSFVLPDGYIGAVPDSDPSMFKNGLYPRRVPPPIPQLEAWLTDRGVSAIVVMDEVRSWFEPTLREMGYAPVQAGDGVSVWRAA